MISSFTSVFPLLLALMSLLGNLGVNGNHIENDDADEYFAKCCQDIRGLPADIAEIACKYPPGTLALGQQRVLAKVFSEYIGCYAAHKNNRQCCADGGCTGIHKPCQDLCDGVNPPRASVIYLHCGAKKPVISDCNKAAWGGQSVASQRDHNLDGAMKLLEVQKLVGEVLADLQFEEQLPHLLD